MARAKGKNLTLEHSSSSVFENILTLIIHDHFQVKIMERVYCILLLGVLRRTNVFSTHESMKNDFKDLYWKCSMWI